VEAEGANNENHGMFVTAAATMAGTSLKQQQQQRRGRRLTIMLMV
jgi:hypothetical protein